MTSSSVAVRTEALANRHPSATVGGAMLLSSLLVYAGYWNDMASVFRYWDGPLYAYVAKTLYAIPEAHPFSHGLPPAFFASYLPAYPMLIRLFMLLVPGHYGPPMLLATLTSAVAAAILFRKVLAEYDLVRSPLWTALLFCWLPPRWLIYHAVGATEPLFFVWVFATLLALKRGRTLWVLVFVVLASWTRITGALLVPIVALVYAQRREWRSLALTPISALGTLSLFTFYHYRFGDFFAYVTWQGKVGRLVNPIPLRVFWEYAQTPQHHSAELFLVYHVTLLAGSLALWRHREVFTYCAVFFVFGLFMYNSDLGRILLPAFPFALLVGLDPVLSRREFRWALPLLVVMGTLYAWGHLPTNAIPEGDYDRLLALFAGR